MSSRFIFDDRLIIKIKGEERCDLFINNMREMCKFIEDIRDCYDTENDGEWGYDDWDKVDFLHWKNRTPSWFREKCIPEMSEEEMEMFDARYRSISQEERYKEDLYGLLSLEGWITAVLVDNGSWNIEKIDRLKNDEFMLTYKSVDFIVPLSSLFWLIRCAANFNLELYEFDDRKKRRGILILSSHYIF